MHNHLRQLLLNGTVPGQPQALNLKPISYDAELAYAAQVAANTCKFSHYYYQDPRWGRVGQNMAEGGASFVNSEPEWKRVIQFWFDENKNYRYPYPPDKNTAHYIQIASDDVKFVGCGFSYFFDTRYKMPSFVKLYVCYYGPGNIFKNKPPYVSIYTYKVQRKCG
ncbi:hypothetical protein FQR65_LT00542 [Abscondita terminalis]|nr:hypothetical protein FQR65_LT00542 [Abscondita terminalis]